MKYRVMWLSLMMPALLPLAAVANTELVVAGLGGGAAVLVKNRLIPEFEQKFGVKVVYYPENSAEALQRLRSDRQNGKSTDVAFMDDSLMEQAIDENLCGKIDDHASDAFEAAAHFKDHKAAGIGIVALGLMYNKKVFADNKWPAPTSWRDLADPKFAGRVSLASPKNGYGLTTLLALAHVNGGVNARGVDAAYGMIRKDILPLTPGLANTPSTLLSLFQSEQIVMVPWGSVRAQQLAAESGMPAGIVYPKEGVPTVLVAVCPVQASNNQALAQAFVAMVLSASAQKLFADEVGLLPLRKNTPIRKNGFIPVGVTAIEIDQHFVISNRSNWNRRWTQEIGPLD